MDGHVLVQQGQRRVRLGEPLAARPRCCATSWASRGWSSRTGARSTTGYRRSLAGLDLEMPPAWAQPEPVVAAVQSGEVPDERPRRPGPERAGAGRQGHARAATLDEPFDARRPPRAGPRGGRRVGRAAEERRRLLPLARRREDRRDRRVRPDAAVPGRRLVAGQPDARRRRCSTSCRAVYGEVAVRGRLRPRRDRATTRLCSLRPIAVAASAETVVMVIGLPGADESEGFDRTHMNLPANQLARARGGGRGQPERRRGAGQRLDGRPRRRRPRTRRRWSRPGWAARPAGGAIADVLTGGVEPLRTARRDHPAPAGGQLRRTSTSPATPRSSATARASSSATAATTRPHRDVAFPFGFGLSYTTFELSDLRCHSGSVAEARSPRPSRVTVTNTGDRRGRRGRAGLRRDVESTVVAAGARAQGLRQGLPRAGRVADRCRSSWTSEPSRSGRSTAAALGGRGRATSRSGSARVPGPSLAETVTVDGTVRLAEPLTRDSTLQEWMADPERPSAHRARGVPRASPPPCWRTSS